MDHFVKRFTVIDFLGIFVPGAVLALAVQYYLQGLLPPFETFFGAESPWLAVYFVLVSYVIGILIQEPGKQLEKWIIKGETDPDDLEMAIDLYYKKFYPDTDLDEKHIKTYVDIYHYIRCLPESEQGKVPLFSAFYCMSRNGICSALGVAILAIWDMFNSGLLYQGYFNLLVTTLALISVRLFWRRARRFHANIMVNAYNVFVKRLETVSKV